VPERAYNVLFLCTGNSARSILAEVLLNALGEGRFKAYSAGSFPAGKVNPGTLEILDAQGFDTSGLRSKNWDEFAGADAPRMDFIVTVCDKAAGEQCPFWPGHPVTAHWGFEDPAHVTPEDARRRAFEKVFGEISARIRRLVALPLDNLDRTALQQRLRAIGDGA
jgi:arsenate reductase (thioredoxin)